MQYEVLLIETIERAVHVTLNRPEALNALNRRTIKELHHFFTEGHQEYAPFNGVIITGAGDKSFAAGADITEFSGLDRAAGQAFAQRGHDTFFAIEHFHVPVIAAVNGFALGGGCELAMACHLRLASDNARFGQPEVNLGLIPGYGGTQRLIQYVGKGKALELMLTGDMLNAEAARDAGLVNAVTSQEELLDACRALITKIATKGPLAVQAVIASVNAYFTEGYNGFEAEIQNFTGLMETDDFSEGAAAFLAKRKAEFKGH